MDWLCGGEKSWSVGSKVCLDGNARHAIAQIISSSQQVLGEVETGSEIFMASPNAAFEHCKKYNVAGFSFGVRAFGRRSRPKETKLPVGVAKMVANVLGVKKSPWMEMDQWRFWHRTGHRWIEKSNMNVFIAIRERMFSWAGHVDRMDCEKICAKALRCRWRWRQFYCEESEKDKWFGPHPQRLKICRWENMVVGEVVQFIGNACDFSESVQESTGWLHLA